uniref:RNA helicase n=1 Tax=Scleropages formosus TaxID=113540 RepID=A0A8C9WRI4_SCLFO
MSYGYGSRRGRRGGRSFGDGGDDERWDRHRGTTWAGAGAGGAGPGASGGGGGGAAQRNLGWEEQGASAGRGGGSRGRHPAHLKGREIGLWYAKRGGMKRKEEERKSRAVVQMDESREEHITQLLNKVQRDTPAAASSGAAGATPVKQHNSVAEIWPVASELNVVTCVSVVFVLIQTSPHGSYFDGEEPPKEAPPAERKEVKETPKDRSLEFLFQELVRNSTLDQELKRDLQSKRSDQKYLEMLKFREKLPSYGMKEELVQLIRANQVMVVSGETGCGKTTQVTQFILDDSIQRGMGSICRVVCTQPRRISAISVAERVAAERAEAVGEGNSCGYQIRLQSRLPRKQGSMLYCTTGIILQWLRSDPCESLLTFFNHLAGNCPMIHIPGFTYPVKEYLLEDVVQMLRYRPQSQDRRPKWKRRFMQGQMSRPEKEQKEEEYQESWPCYARTLRDRYSDSTIEVLEMMDDDDKVDLSLIVELIKYIVLQEEDGAILVFLPGWDNISGLNDLLMAQQMLKSDKFIIIPLHSLMPTVSQTQVFKKPPPGVRKIVIATNIAETSITIDDVVYVIDGGKIKETHFDTQNNISTMTAEWVSLANAKQRKGRAGRSVSLSLSLVIFLPITSILKLGRIASFLQKAMDPPSEQAVQLAITHLMELNALDHHEELTPLGFHLARLPVEPHIGKMILFGALLGCLDPVLTIAASLSFKDPFFIPLGKEKLADMRRKALSKNSKSDHLTVVNAFWGWEEAKRRGYKCEREYCWDNFLSANTLQMLHNMKGQFAEHLLCAGFVSSKDPKDPASNINSGKWFLFHFYKAGPYFILIFAPQSSHRGRPADGKVNIHPKSVNAEETEFHYTWLIYHLKMKTSSIFLYDCTEVSPFSLLFFGGDISIQKDQEQDTIAVDEWIVFQSPARIAHLVKNLKTELDSLLEEKIKNPQPVDWSNSKSKDCAVILAIIDLITTQESNAGSSGGTQAGGRYYD